MRESEFLRLKYNSEWLIERIPDVDAVGVGEDQDIVRDAIAKGNEVWRFRTPAHTWKKRHGRAGIAVLRDGIPLTMYVVLMN